MASGNSKKRKSLSSDSKHVSPKKKKPLLSPIKKTPPSAHDSKGCAILAKLIDSGVVSDLETVFYLRKKDKSVMKEGAVTRDGVLCKCCGNLFLLSRFEVHAGSGLHRPSANMFLRDGRSLMQCQQAIESGDAHIEPAIRHSTDCSSSNESSGLQENSPRDNDRNDNICQICGDGGQLMLCDTCPSAFHAECLLLDAVPDGEWHCPRCRCGACGGSIRKAALQVSGLKCAPVDPSHDFWKNESKVPASPSVDHVCLQEDDTRELTRISKDWTSQSSIVESLQQDKFGLQKALFYKKQCAILSCSHCQVPYHPECVKGASQPEYDGHWFCTKHCKHVFKKLRRIVGRPYALDRGLTWVLIRSCKGDRDGTQKNSVYASFERRLSEACKVMQQSFDPVIDYETGIDLLSQTVFNRKADLRRLDCTGFYTMLLMKGEQMVSVATLRVHGRELAEMPFVATKDEFRQQGMCKTLMKALESILIDVGVYKLVLPSVDELLETWTGSFGFKVMNVEESKQVLDLGLLMFPGTTLLHKSLMRSETVNVQESAIGSVENKGQQGFIRIRVKLHPSSKPATSVQPISCH